MAILTKKTIQVRIIERLRDKPAIMYGELRHKCLPAPIELDDKSRFYFDEILQELKRDGVISWQSGEIVLLQAETAAFGAAPENASLKRKGTFKRRKRA